jgi:hypothetical protein
MRVHTPTEDKNEEEKDAFYDDLDKTYEVCALGGMSE